MADVKVRFLHPTNGGSVEVTLDDEMTAGDAIKELVAADFLPRSEDGYLLTPKGGSEMRADTTFRSAGVRDGSTVRIDPGALAGRGRR